MWQNPKLTERHDLWPPRRNHVNVVPDAPPRPTLVMRYSNLTREEVLNDALDTVTETLGSADIDVLWLEDSIREKHVVQIRFVHGGWLSGKIRNMTTYQDRQRVE